MSDLTLTSSTGTYSVNLTKLNPSITRTGSNPLIIIPIPTGLDADTFAGAISINLKMLSDKIDIKFSLTDGVGTHSYTAPSTNYEKLWYMFKHDDGKKILLWEGFSFSVEMESLTTPTDAGNFKLMQNCSMLLAVVNP
jgi:hypothetical protein